MRERGYGVVDVKTRQPAKVDTFFQVAAISKPVTAIAALRHVQNDLLSLDVVVSTSLKTRQVSKSDLILKWREEQKRVLLEDRFRYTRSRPKEVYMGALCPKP